MSPLGDRLRKERESRKIPLEEIARETRINLRFLDALETGEFDQLPGGAFNKGFISNYARYLGLDPKPLIQEYEQEEVTQTLEGRLPERPDVLDEMRESLTLRGVGPGGPLSRGLKQIGPVVGGLAVIAIVVWIVAPGLTGLTEISFLGGWVGGSKTSRIGELAQAGGTLPEPSASAEATEPLHVADASNDTTAAADAGIEGASTTDAADERAVPDANTIDESSQVKLAKRETEFVPPPATDEHALADAKPIGRSSPADLANREIDAGSADTRTTDATGGAAVASNRVSPDQDEQDEQAVKLASVDETPAQNAGEERPQPLQASDTSGSYDAPNPATASRGSSNGRLPPGTTDESSESAVGRASPGVVTPAADAIQEAAAGLTVSEAGVGTAVIDRQLFGESNLFREGSTVYFWTRVIGGEAGDEIRHVWIHEGRPQGLVPLTVNGSHWRTHSRWQLGRGAQGLWAVEARDSDGRVLSRLEFLCE